MLRMVGDQVVNVVTALPPPNGQATAEVGNKDPNHSVGEHGMSDTSMTCVMGSKHYLML